MLLDYEFLKLFWWLLIGIVLIGFAIMDGFDLGVAGLIPVLGKNDTERRIMINTIAPHWDGNQVWFIVAGGAVFAAWPLVYGTLFSGFYWAMMLVLFSLMIRPLALEYRAKVSPSQKRYCDIALVVSGVIPAASCGIVFGNLFVGYDFSIDFTMRSEFTESFWGLLNPFALLCGLTSLLMLLMHGAAWLKMRTEGVLYQRACQWMQWLALATLVLFVIGGFWVAQLPGYKILSMPESGSVLTPLMKQVVRSGTGSWLANYSLYPITILAPVIGCLSLLATVTLARRPLAGLSFVSSIVSIASIVATAGLALFPFILPSRTMPEASLTLWDAASSQLTLSIMTVAALIIVPVIVMYTSWCLWKMRGKVTEKFVLKNQHALY